MRTGWITGFGSAGAPARGALLLLLGSSACACSWSRFDDVTKDSPIVLLEKPGSMKQGFGISVATAKHDQEVEVLVGGGVGVSGAALYAIGDGESPGTTSIDTGYCSGSALPCYLASSLAGFGTATGPDHEHTLCFGVGAGSVSGNGIIARCQDASEYTLTIPNRAETVLNSALIDVQPDDFPLATDRTDHPSLLASSPTARVAWFYPAQSLEFSQLEVPKDLPIDDDTFGKSLAVLSVGDGRVYAVGVSNKNEVLLWKSDGSKSSSYIGCLGGTPGFGRALAAGKVNRDDDADLVVSDNVNVHVIDGRALFDLPETTSSDCSFASLPAGALLDSFGCGSNKSLSGCDGSEFGAALAVGDLDGDGDGEVIVGAPSMTVRDLSQAGALLVYDAETPTDSTLADAKFLSSAEQGDQLGRSIATPSIKGRDIIVAGAPGNGKAGLFYCSALTAAGKAGSRCP
jgi:hypothetical protein